MQYGIRSVSMDDIANSLGMSKKTLYQYYADKKGNNFQSPYTAAAASAILSVGVNVDVFGANQKQAALQSGLIRLGKTIGNIDGQIGNNTHKALDELGVNFTPADIDSMLIQVENLVQQKFPAEFSSGLII